MIQIGILEQLKILYEIFINNKYVLNISIIAGLALIILELLNVFSSKKITKIISFLIYALIVGSLVFFYHTEIITFLDYLVNNIFVLLLFPNFAVYTLVIILINIFMLKSIFGKYNRLYKNINIIFFILFNVIFYLIIDNIVKNNISIYEQLNVYTNSNLLVLIQVSMNLFCIWLLVMLVIKIVSLFTGHLPSKDLALETIYDSEDSNDSMIVDINPSMVLESVQPKIDYNSYLNIKPIKKDNKQKKKSEVNHDDDMEIVFGKNNHLDNIMSDINKLKDNKYDQDSLQKIYDEISVNDLSLNDYNYLINILKDIKNN